MPRRSPDMLPREQRDTLTVQLNRIGDENMKRWIEDELYHGKRAGRMPSDWDASLMIKAILRGEYQPISPAPGPDPEQAPAQPEQAPIKKARRSVRK